LSTGHSNKEVSSLKGLGLIVQPFFGREMKKAIWIVAALALSVLLAPAFCSADINDDLMRAIRNNDVGKVREAIDAGVDINFTKEVSNWTPLMWAASFGHVEIAKLLIDKGANVNAISASSDKSGGQETPLMIAALRGNTEIAKLLIEKGADVQAKNSEGWTPFIWAASFNQVETAKLLLEKGAEIDGKSSDGITPLWRAASFGHNEIIKFLIANGADVNAKDLNGNTAMDTAKLKNHKETAELLQAAGGQSTSRGEPKPKKNYF